MLPFLLRVKNVHKLMSIAVLPHRCGSRSDHYFSQKQIPSSLSPSFLSPFLCCSLCCPCTCASRKPTTETTRLHRTRTIAGAIEIRHTATRSTVPNGVCFTCSCTLCRQRRHLRLRVRRCAAHFPSPARHHGRPAAAPAVVVPLLLLLHPLRCCCGGGPPSITSAAPQCSDNP